MEIEPGLTAIAGGKYTTYRVMAEDVVDFAIKDSQPGRPSLTRSIPVIGAQGLPHPGARQAGDRPTVRLRRDRAWIGCSSATARC